MTFQEITKMMLNSMDFFELRRTAARYAVAYQGVRRQKLVRDLERKILAKAIPQGIFTADIPVTQLSAQQGPEGAMSARPKLAAQSKNLGGARINMFSTRNLIPRSRI